MIERRARERDPNEDRALRRMAEEALTDLTDYKSAFVDLEVSNLKYNEATYEVIEEQAEEIKQLQKDNELMLIALNTIAGYLPDSSRNSKDIARLTLDHIR